MNCPDEYDMRLGSVYIAFAVEDNLRNADVQERLKPMANHDLRQDDCLKTIATVFFLLGF
jgi:hypothetical protein